MGADLDDLGPAVLAELDPQDHAAAVASAAARVRESGTLAHEADLSRIREDGRPRAVLLVGRGVAAIAARAWVAACGTGGPVLLAVAHPDELPGWIGPVDLVVGAAGVDDPLVATALEQVVRRGSHVAAVAGARTSIAEVVEQGRGTLVPIPATPPGLELWSVLPALAVLGDAANVAPTPPVTLETAATVLEELARRCHPSAESFVNPAKALAHDLAGTVPIVWGDGALIGVAAERFAERLAAAGMAAVSAALPGALSTQAALLEQPSRSPAADEDDFFRDRADDVDSTPRHLVLLPDAELSPAVDEARSLARAGGVGVAEIAPDAGPALARFAAHAGLADWVGLYVALAGGRDPSRTAGPDRAPLPA
ncbi:MAG TPA: SIS domain-containing protein [Mycobacteriales bacterium]|nr:SIS domain-containing protein [Mycobacteriales bacterium]